MKGIILAGGSGTRLYPVTRTVCKQLLPIYDKPMIYYPLSTLMLGGIKEILIISTPQDISKFEELFSDGSHLGLNISYKIQPSPDGLAQAFILGEEFIGDDDVCLILGDNIFYGQGLTDVLLKSKKIVEMDSKCVVFGYYVNDPQRYGVVEFDNKKNVISLEEKPANPKSNYAVVGLYFYTNDVIQIAKKIKPSKRGELEITTVNQEYLNMGRLNVQLMERGFAWLDTGTHESMMDASNFIETVEKRQGLKIACIEEIAFLRNLITIEQLQTLSDQYKNEYGSYLKMIVKNNA